MLLAGTRTGGAVEAPASAVQPPEGSRRGTGARLAEAPDVRPGAQRGAGCSGCVGLETGCWGRCRQATRWR